MIYFEDFISMGALEKTSWLERNRPANKSSLSGRKPVYGIGINDALYCVKPRLNGRQVVDPAYETWQGMLERAYSTKLHEKLPTYIGVNVCSEWHSFMSFREWWMVHQVEGWHLDKDIIGNHREYSPEKCIFVPDWINVFTTDHRSARGDWPIGVHFDNGSGLFRAKCSNKSKKKQEHLGMFKSAECAHRAWRNRKIEMINIMKAETDRIDKRIHDGLLRIIKEAV